MLIQSLQLILMELLQKYIVYHSKWASLFTDWYWQQSGGGCSDTPGLSKRHPLPPTVHFVLWHRGRRARQGPQVIRERSDLHFLRSWINMTIDNSSVVRLTTRCLSGIRKYILTIVFALLSAKWYLITEWFKTKTNFLKL